MKSFFEVITFIVWVIYGTTYAFLKDVWLSTKGEDSVSQVRKNMVK